MKGVDAKAEEAVKRFSCHKKITVALSGGRDSVCLADMLVRFTTGAEISAVHVNHHLRREADDEEQFVRELCKGYGIRLRVESIDVISGLNGRSVETAAREMRREIFFREAQSGAAVALAHHAYDRAESILMHILRGSGVEGLVGMSYSDGHIIRPILDFMPEELDEYARLHNLKFVTDTSNFDCAYDRNFIRLKVLPLLSERYPAVRSLIRLSEHAAICEGFTQKHLDYSAIRGEGDEVTLDIERLTDPYSSYKTVVKALSLLGLKKDYTSSHINAVLRLKDSVSGAEFSFLGITAIREFGRIRLVKGNVEDKIQPIELPFKDGVTKIGDVTLQIKSASYGSEKNGIGEVKCLYFDGDKVPDNAVIRFRREGDRFRPFGSGEKKLKKFFIDEKVPLTKRSSIPLIAADDEILAVAGIEISDGVKCEKSTKRTMSLRVLDGLDFLS